MPKSKLFSSLPQSIFSKQKKTNPKKTFFQNYADHLSYLEVQLDRVCADIGNMSKSDEVLNYLTNEALARLKIFDALRDGYDYFDEVCGATAVPILGLAASLGLTALSIWEGIKELATKMGMRENDGEKHGNLAATYLLCAGASFVLSVASFIKSAFSLVSRPIVTAVQGFKPQDTVRFYCEDSVQHQVGLGI